VEPLREMGRMLLLLGGVLVVVGALLAFGSKLPFRLGRLPGDIVWQGRNTSFYFPVVTCLVLSVVLSAILWLAGMLRK
jgi:hypothetical protein